MSLAINVDHVTGVLLADGWHVVKNLDDGRSSFDLDSYEYVGDAGTLHGGGQSGISATGFTFSEPEDGVVSGPLTAILAVRTQSS